MRNTSLFLSTCRAGFSFQSSSLAVAFILRTVTATASNLYYSIHPHSSYFPFAASCHCYTSLILYQLTIHKHCQVKWSFLCVRLGEKKKTQNLQGNIFIILTFFDAAENTGHFFSTREAFYLINFSCPYSCLNKAKWFSFKRFSRILQKYNSSIKTT